MQFFLYEIVARLVAIYLFFDCTRILRTGFAERKIAVINDDWLDWSRWSNWVANRDTAPVSYWMTIVLRVFSAFACIIVAIFGWWHPNG